MTPKQTLTPANLRKWRHRCGLTQAGLAEYLGVTQQLCGHYETGLHAVTPRTIKQLLALAKEWGVEPPVLKPRWIKLEPTK